MYKIHITVFFNVDIVKIKIKNETQNKVFNILDITQHLNLIV